jgi:uncharacterized membrane protein
MKINLGGYMKQVLHKFYFKNTLKITIAFYFLLIVSIGMFIYFMQELMKLRHEMLMRELRDCNCQEFCSDFYKET